MSVRDIDSQPVWTVRRRWLPWRPARVTSPDETPLAVEMFGRNFPGALLSYLAALAFVVLLVLVIAQRFAVLAVIPVLLFIRLLLPWFVVARRADRPAEAYYGKANTWPAASRLISTVHQEIRQTGTPQSLTPTHQPAPQ